MEYQMSSYKQFTLVFIRSASQILLGLKRRGFGEGKWNGFGGKVEPAESILQAAVREVQEECGLTPSNLRRIGLLHFEFEGDPTIMEVHVFQTKSYTGTLRDSEEMLPLWYDYKDIPFDRMWLDDRYWFPWMLKNEPFKGYFLYRGKNLILDHKIEKLDIKKFKFESAPRS